jgi:hypothetical protein
MKIEDLELWCNREDDDGNGNFTLIPKDYILLVWDGDIIDGPYVVKDIEFFDAENDIHDEDNSPGVNINHNGLEDFSVSYDLSNFYNLQFSVYTKVEK